MTAGKESEFKTDVYWDILVSVSLSSAYMSTCMERQILVGMLF